VIVDWLTKLAHFVPIKTGMSVAKLADIYIEQIIRLHGIPSRISIGIRAGTLPVLV
jgi:hypothetical protein